MLVVAMKTHGEGVKRTVVAGKQCSGHFNAAVGMDMDAHNVHEAVGRRHHARIIDVAIVGVFLKQRLSGIFDTVNF